MNQGQNIFREAGSAPTDARLQELIANSGVEANTLGDLGDIGTDAIADIGDFIDKADFGGQKGVGGVLDHFCRTEVRL